jgi:hypothetical protein
VKRLDHLVYGTKNLDATVDALAAQLGVRPAPGGRHSGFGTRNAILAIGPTSNLELTSPDPTQPPPPTRRWFGIDDLVAPRIVAWAVNGAALEARAAEASAAGFPLGPVEGGSRQRPDGQLLGASPIPASSPPKAWCPSSFIGAREPIPRRAESPKPEPVLALSSGLLGCR